MSYWLHPAETDYLKHWEFLIFCFTIWQDTAKESKSFYEDSDKDEEEQEAKEKKEPTYVMDTDHRLLLRQAKPLLNSRNSAVCITS